MERMSGGEIKVCCLARPPHEPPLSRPSATLSPAQSGGEGRERGRAPVQGFNARIFRGILILTFSLGEKEQPLWRSGCTEISCKSSRAKFYETEIDSPSPWGEGRDEGVRANLTSSNPVSGHGAHVGRRNKSLLLGSPSP